MREGARGFSKQLSMGSPSFYFDSFPHLLIAYTVGNNLSLGMQVHHTSDWYQHHATHDQNSFNKLTCILITNY